MDSLLQDLRFATRSLRRSPGFALVAVLTLALGIGATTAIFSVVHGVLLRPLPVAEPERLVTVEEIRTGRVVQAMRQYAYSLDRYRQLREGAGELFTGLAGQRIRELSLRADGPARVLRGVEASANYFEVLGVHPAAGRLFPADADRPGSAPVVVLSHDLWQQQFGRDPSVVGRTIQLNSRPVTVVGVAPAGFGGTTAGLVADVWIPIGTRQPAEVEAAAGTPWVTVFGRLRPGVTLDQARAGVEVLTRQIPVETAETRIGGVRLEPLTPVPAAARGALVGFMAMLLSTAGLVLLIAGTNVAGMLLARAVARRREMAIRLAIGAGRGRLVWQLLTESLLLFLLAAGVGLVLTAWIAELISAFEPPTPVRVVLDLGVDARVLGFALAMALGTGVLFGLAPALQATRSDLIPALKDGEAGRGTPRARLRSVFVVAQLAMSLVLLITAGLFTRTLQKALDVDPGFDPRGVVVAGIGLGAHGYDEERGRAVFRQLVERLRGSAEVESAALARFAPLSGSVMADDVQEVDGRPLGERATAQYNVVEPDFFSTLRIPLRAGRPIGEGDREGAPPVAVVNEAMAGRLWPGRSPLGHSFTSSGVEFEVVGVVADGKYESYRDEETLHYYLPFAQHYSAAMTLHVRARGAPGAALQAIRRELAAIDPNVALEQAMPLTSQMSVFLLPQRLAAVLIGAFGLAGLLLAAIGVYGILSYHVAQRTREMGIRMALGASMASVRRLVVRQGMTLVALGVGLGLTAAFGATRLLSGLLYGISATDPATFALVPLLLTTVALLASYLPARRATRVDAMTTLRSE